MDKNRFPDLAGELFYVRIFASFIFRRRITFNPSFPRG
jgi:hypothetical protein